MYTIQIAFQFSFWLKLSEEVCKIIYLLLNLCIFSLKKKKKKDHLNLQEKKGNRKEEKNVEVTILEPLFSL